MQDTFEFEGIPKLVRLVLDDDEPCIEVRDIAPTSSSTDNEQEGSTIKRTLLLDDIIGCSTSTPISPSSSSPSSPTKKTLLEIFAYPRIVKGPHCFHHLDPTRASRSAGHLRLVSSDAAMAKRWDTQIKSLCCRNWPRREWQQQQQQQQQQGEARRRRLLVIVNPVSGRRRSLSIYHSVVKPMFTQAGVEDDLIVTNRAHHAKDVAREMDVEAWDGIVTIGGDGILSEIVNGLYEQDDKTALQRMPLAIIKGGTGNGLFSSVMHRNKEANEPLNAVFVILKAQRTILTDLSLVETGDGKKQLSFLSLSYAIIADVDIGSETLRWAGAARMDLYALYCILRKRRYHLTFSLLPCEKGEEEGGARGGIGTLLPPLETPLPVGEGWVHLEDDFFMVLITHVSHIAETVHSSPGKRFGDGTFHIQILRKPISRLRLISLFSALEHGGHVGGEEVEVYHARAYRLTPFNKEGTYSMDGEEIEHGPVQALILPQAIQLLGSLE